MDLNAKKKYRLIEIETPTTEETEEYENSYLIFIKQVIKATFKLLRFSLYLIISFLEMFIKLIKVLFLNNYEPFGTVKETGNSFLNRIAKKEINKEKIRFSTQKLTSHTYEFERSDLYNATYKYIQEKLKDFADNNVAINESIYRDILAKVDVITVEVERKALMEGYSYASFTKYRFSDEDEIYNNFLEFKIMRGEGQNGKANKKSTESRD